MLKIGDLIATRNIRSYFTSPEARGWGEYKAEKSKNMVFMYLGQEPTNGTQPINPDIILNKMGWKIVMPKK